MILNLDYKKIFIGIAILFFIVLPITSFHYGISGDERFHSVWGKICYDFYATGGQDTTALVYDFGDGGKVIYYGPSVDLFSEFIMKVFHIDRDRYMFELKHWMDSLVLCMMILVGGLMARSLAGWRAGVIALLLFLFYPRLIGDGMNNPKDSIFAGFYLLTLYNMFQIIRYLPRPKWIHIIGAALGFGFALGNRIGALLLIAYFGVYLLGFLFFNREKILEVKNNAKEILIKLSVFVVGGYILGVVFWPYAVVSPISHVKEALDYFTNQPYVLKTLFEGQKIGSNELPWYYIFKWILITAPEVTLVGVLIFIVFLFKNFNIKRDYFYFCLLFAFLFPIVYLIYKKSGLYNGIRHVSFVIPPMVILSSLGYNYLFEKYNQSKYKYIVYGLFALGLLLPLKFMIQNHSMELVYFNNFSGGTKHAVGNYDTDYFGVTLRKATDWLLENEKIDTNTKIGINYAPFSINYYLNKVHPKLNANYIRYNERENSDYDYYIVNTALLDPSMAQNGQFPPAGTIKVIEVDGAPMTAIVKRLDKNGFYGKKALDSNRFDVAIPLLLKSIQAEPNNDLSWANLGFAYLNTNKYKEAIEALNRAVQIAPDNLQALNLLGYAYLQSGDVSKAQYMFQNIIDINPNTPDPYRMLAQIYQQQGNNAMAQQYMSIYQQITGQQ